MSTGYWVYRAATLPRDGAMWRDVARMSERTNWRACACESVRFDDDERLIGSAFRGADNLYAALTRRNLRVILWRRRSYDDVRRPECNLTYNLWDDVCAYMKTEREKERK